MPDNKPVFAKILVAITEDWFLLSHFRPLIAELRQLAREVVVVTRDSDRLAEVAVDSACARSISTTTAPP